MAYLKFDSAQLINLEYSLNREILRTNRGGSYSCTTIIGCNTRKYHGLLISPVEKFEGDRFVFLSSLDETVIQHDSEFNLGIHKYEGDHYSPKGHKYFKEFEAEVIASATFRVGGVILKKENLLVDQNEQILIKYTLEEAHSPTKLRFKPLLAFRNIHELTHSNMSVNTKIEKVKNGIKSNIYAGFPNLYMQFSKAAEFVQVPDWYHNVEYLEEMNRGYEFKEDLFIPGYFEVDIKKGESIIFSASLHEEDPAMFKQNFKEEFEKRTPRDSFRNCLVNAAQQFIVRNGDKAEIIAGYPWFGTWGRDTFIALPGLTLSINSPSTFISVINTMVHRMKGGLFPNTGNEFHPRFNSVDAPLWFFWALQQYYLSPESTIDLWKEYGQNMKDILDSYESGSSYNIKMHDNGLIFAGKEGRALTWMDAVIDNVPVTPRIGYAVEINALWYNAIMFCLELAKKADDKKFIKHWNSKAELIEASFIDNFWSDEKGYLADFTNTDEKDWSVRPNMIIPAALEYSPLTKEMKKSIVDMVSSELLTPRGLRTLSPKNPKYKGLYEGSQEERDLAYHQGSVWPWLLEHYCTAYLKLYKLAGIPHVKKILTNFEDEMTIHGIGSISEIYNGDPPHLAKGAISQAWSVAALLRIFTLIDNFNK